VSEGNVTSIHESRFTIYGSEFDIGHWKLGALLSLPAPRAKPFGVERWDLFWLLYVK